jgi:hypothetical protein
MKKRTMRQPIVITTPYPTPEQVAKNYGVSQKRLKELGAMVDEFLSKSSAQGSRRGKRNVLLPKQPQVKARKRVRVEAGSVF